MVELTERKVIINNKEKLIWKNRQGSYLVYLDDDDIDFLNKGY